MKLNWREKNEQNSSYAIELATVDFVGQRNVFVWFTLWILRREERRHWATSGGSPLFGLVEWCSTGQALEHGISKTDRPRVMGFLSHSQRDVH
jgi:hypothetical protein